jgi:hypothetical protein
MFHAVFQILVNYVEGELAPLEMASAKYMLEENRINSDTLFWYNLPFWKKWKERKRWRRLLGLTFLNDAISNVSEDTKQQVVFYQKVKDLYFWYVYIRPRRTEPWVLEYPASYTLMETHAEEDTEKMIELAKIRRSLWT